MTSLFRCPVAATLLVVGLAVPIQAESFALRCDGVDDWVDVPGFRHDLDEFTVEAWVLRDRPNDDTFDTIVSSDEFRFQVDRDEQIAFKTTIGILPAHGPVVPPDGTWHHVAAIWKHEHVEFVVDGASSIHARSPGEVDLRVERLRIGHDGLSGLGGADPFRGRIDEVRVWDHVRSNTDIARFRFVRFPSGAPGLIGYWTLDDGSGPVAADSSGLSQDGVLGLSPESDRRDPTWEVVSQRLTPAVARRCGYAPLTLDLVVPQDLGAVDAEWSFGDGLASAGLAVRHEFAAAGFYDITARLTIPESPEVELVAGRLTIYGVAPVAAMRADVSSGDLPLTVAFRDDSVGSVATRTWRFGGDPSHVSPTRSTDAEPLATYFSPGRHEASLRVVGPCDEDELNESRSTTTITIGEFIRGDADADGQLTISDARQLLTFFFVPSEPAAIDCRDAADADDDGELSVTDPIVILLALFAGRAPPPPPFENVGHDPTPDELDCLRTAE